LRKLLIGALGLGLTGCSHAPPLQTAAASSADANGFSCSGSSAAGLPATPASFRTRAKSFHGANTAVPDHADAATTPAPSTSKPGSASSRIPLPRPSPRIAEPATTAAVPTASDPADGRDATVSPAEWQGTPPVPRPVQEQAAVATAGAEKSNPPVSTDDGFVAVLMARLNIASVSDLTGKSIAIDDTYSASSGTIRTAIVAAGATAVQLSEQSTFAIDRLTSGEVPAAVVALMSAEAAAGFPDIAGFRIFRVPLSPRPLQERR
jgi:hypothetical protein